MTITHLVTHSGGFHADELLSSAVLMTLFPQAKVVRTRDDRITTPGAGKIIYDVGRAYDAQAGIFDHHQRPAPLRENGQPYSSFGLIWRHFGRDYLRHHQVPEQDIDEIHRSFDESFVVPIDLLDNGAISPSVAGPLSDLTLPALLETLKPVYDERGENADDAAFRAAIPIARAFVESAIRGRAAKCRAMSVVLEAIKAAGDGPVLELPMGMPYREAIARAGADHLLFVVHPRDQDWAINGIRLNEGTFEQRADLPASWAGLTDDALEVASGVKGARFCHNARFLAVASTREAIMQMADLAVKECRSALAGA
ncbi:MAG: MYG1 family protein [Pelagimonas sp.]|jgi:uncharacterized UPF0160 family protein|nr:MYG1 family protein [Pelagimonas sp.]